MRRCVSALFVSIVLMACSCGRSRRAEARAVTGGDPGAGISAVSRYGCGSCHTISGVPGASGLVGPPLSGIGKRMYLAGMLSNSPANLRHWVEHPTAVNPKTLMPELGVTSQDSKDIAALLYSLK